MKVKKTSYDLLLSWMLCQPNYSEKMISLNTNYMRLQAAQKLGGF